MKKKSKKSKKLSKQLFCVWLHNKTSREDDEPIKVRATCKEEARQIASELQLNRFTVGAVYTIKEFSKATGWPHTWAKLVT